MSQKDRQSRGGKMKLRQAAEICRRHAETCKECFIPIMDEEGNPQFVSEACAEGAQHRKAEADYFNERGMADEWIDRRKGGSR